MTESPPELPYRRNVGAVLFNRDGLVLVGRRVAHADGVGPPIAWQLPQGGIDEGESPADAVLRELAEEIGTANATILGEHATWLTYDLPADLVGRAFGGRYRGQRQRWFALRFDGTDDEIRLDAHGAPEFDAWRWVKLCDLPGLAVAFKRPIYEVIAREFVIYGAALDQNAALPESS